MKITGTSTLAAPPQQVWDAVHDPAVLARCLPGCERLTEVGHDHYAMTVTAGVAAIKGTYSGSCALSDLKERESLVMKLQGAGAPGTIDASVDVAFDDLGAEGTRISYEADAVVGGMVGGVGQRMLSSVSKRMAGEFFSNVGNAIAAPPSAEPAAAGPSATPGVFTAPAKPGGISSQDDFVKGIVVGAGLVLLGVVAGAIFGRRR